MEVDIRVKEVSTECIDSFDKPLRDMCIAQMFTNNGTVFGFHQGIIIGMSWS